MGNRVAKKILDNNGDVVSVTYYIRDAQGNVMATYQRGYAGEAQYMKLEELHIYGSQRIGMRTKPVHVAEGNVEGGLVDMLEELWRTKGGNPLARGDKRYELTNHLGNVLMVITDRKLLFSREGTRYFTADQVSFTDYYPFGLEMRDVAATGNATEDRYWVREEENGYLKMLNRKPKSKIT